MNIDRLYKRLYTSLEKEILKGEKRYHVGAMSLDSSGKVLSVGFNSYHKTHPRQKKYSLKTGSPDKCYLHAEIASLVKARGLVTSMLVLRMTKGGEIKISKPCRICTMAMKEAGVKQVFYTDREGIIRMYSLRRFL
jgi:deoxycytidylate deaminase